MVNGRIILDLNKESKLSRNTEVRHREETYFLKDKLSRDLILTMSLIINVLQSQWRDLHDVPNVETPYPVCLIQVPKKIPHVAFIKESWDDEVVDGNRVSREHSLLWDHLLNKHV